jgi:hypothetical protein
MTTLETLKAARKLIEDEQDWYKAPPEASLGKKRVGAKTKRCVGAAICDAGSPWPSNKAVWTALKEQMGGEEIYEFNFTHTHAEVLRAFDEAIAKLGVA